MLVCRRRFWGEGYDIVGEGFAALDHCFVGGTGVWWCDWKAERLDCRVGNQEAALPKMYQFSQPH